MATPPKNSPPAGAAGEPKARQALLLGASGLVGGFCLQALLAEPAYARIVLLNRRELPAVTHSRLAEKIVDFEKLTVADFAGAGDVFCALGTTIKKAGSQAAFRRVDLEYPLAAARLARQAGAKQFMLVSSVGADASSKNFYLRTKGELETEIGKLGFQAVHIFRPSLLLGRREDFRFGERAIQVIAPALTFVMAGSLRRYRAIQADAVGKALVAAAREEKSGSFVHEYDQIIRLASL